MHFNEPDTIAPVILVRLKSQPPPQGGVDAAITVMVRTMRDATGLCAAAVSSRRVV